MRENDAALPKNLEVTLLNVTTVVSVDDAKTNDVIAVRSGEISSGYEPDDAVSHAVDTDDAAVVTGDTADSRIDEAYAHGDSPAIAVETCTADRDDFGLTGKVLGCYAVVRLSRQGAEHIFRIPFREIQSFDYLAASGMLEFSFDSKEKKLLAKEIGAQKNADTPQKYMVRFTRLGFCRVRGQLCYCAGDRVFAPGLRRDEYEIGPEITERVSLIPAAPISEYEAARRFKDIMELYPSISDLLAAACALGFMRSLIASAIKPHNPSPCTVYLVGSSGWFKTVFISLITEFYSASERYAPVQAVNSGLWNQREMMSFYRDSVVVSDDINHAYRQNYKSGSENALKLTREAANNRGHQSSRQSNEIAAQLIISAEEVPSVDLTNAARMFVAKMEHEFDQEELAPLRNAQEGSTSAFWQGFIRYCIAHEAQIIDDFRDNLRTLHSEHIDAIQRHVEMIVLLATAYSFLLCYINEAGRYGRSMEELKNTANDFYERIEKNQKRLSAVNVSPVAVDPKTAARMAFLENPAAYIWRLLYDENGKRRSDGIIGVKGSLCWEKDFRVYISYAEFKGCLENKLGLPKSEVRKLKSYMYNAGILDTDCLESNGQFKKKQGRRCMVLRKYKLHAEALDPKHRWPLNDSAAVIKEVMP